MFTDGGLGEVNKDGLERGEKTACDGFHRSPFRVHPPFTSSPPPPLTQNKSQSPRSGGGDTSLDQVYDHDEFHSEFRSWRARWGEGGTAVR